MPGRWKGPGVWHQTARRTYYRVLTGLYLTADDNATFERALTTAGVEHEIVVYDGAPHSFFDRKQEEFAEASEDAWGRTLAFIADHS